MAAGATGLMSHVVLCTTGLRSSDKKRCSAIVKALGGRYSGDLTRDVTHLVATEWQSPKYKKAVELGLEIVRPEWVYACEETTTGSASPMDSPSERRFRPLYFKGFKVTVSGSMEREERSILQAEVEGAGGTWLAALTPDTHPLAVTHPEGSKYDAARSAGICVVSLRWCWACVEERSRVELGVYPPQAGDEVPPFRSGWRGAWLRAAPAPLIVPKHEISPASNGTERTDSAHQSHSELQGASEPQRAAARAREAQALQESKLVPAVPEASSDQADIVAVDVDSETVQGQYLDSCWIHPIGFEKAQMKDLVKLIRRGGGTRLVKPDNQVTHIVASLCAPLDGLTHLKAKIVSVSWLVESCKAGRVADTDRHEITKQQARRPSPVVTGATVRRPSPLNLEGGSSLSTIFAGSRSNMIAKPAPEAIVEETRYTARSSPRHGRQHELSGPAVSSKLRSNKARRKPNNQLSGKRFTLSHALSEAEEQQARKLVVEHGGTISQSPVDGLSPQSTGEADSVYSICPHGQSTNTFSLPAFASPGHSSKSGTRSNVTLQWVEDCCHRTMKPGRHADPSVCPAFTPLPFRLPLPDADKCVVCVSGFAGMDRRRIRLLLELVGATVSERLSKQTTTMLVCLIPEGPKYESAVHWRVPIVTVDWLHKSVIEGKLKNPDSGTDLVGKSTTRTLSPRHERQHRHNSGHLVASISGAASIMEGGTSDAVQTESRAELQNGKGSAERASPKEVAQDVITTALPHTQHNCEDIIIEQAESSCSQAILSNGSSERRIVRGSQPLPVQRSASVTTSLPSAQGRPIGPESMGEQIDQAGQIDKDLGSAIDNRKLEFSSAKQLQHETGVSKQSSGDLNTCGKTGKLTNGSILGVNPSHCKPSNPNSVAGVRSDLSNCTQTEQDRTRSPVVRAQSVDQQQDDTVQGESIEHDSTTQQEHEKSTASDDASTTSHESPRHDAALVLKRSLSDSQVTDNAGKENVNNSVDSIGCPATAPEIRSEPMCSAPASTSTSTTQRQKPDLSLLVKDFKRKFQKKVETPREHALMPPAQGIQGDSFSSSSSEPRRVTRSEVERDTTDRPGESVSENGTRGRLKQGSNGFFVPPGDAAASKRVSRRHTVEAATACEVQQRLSARKDQQQSLGTTAPATTVPGNSDDEDMYAESQMVVYDRSFGTSAPATSASRSNISMAPPPQQQNSLPTKRSSPEFKSSPPAKRPRRSTRRNSSSSVAEQTGETAATVASPACAADLKPSTDAAPRVFMVSGLTSVEKKIVTQDIKRLGGVVSNKQSWDKRCTHLIADEVKRVEKTLAACASGRWVVTLEYVKASLRAKRFVDEEPYEHCASQSRRADDVHENRGNELRPDTPHRCRMLRATVPVLNGGLFSGMKALVTLADDRKKKIVVRVLESGGAAQVVTCSCTPSAAQLKPATAIFVDTNQLDEMEETARETGASVYTSDSLSGLLSHGRFDAEDGLYKL